MIEGDRLVSNQASVDDIDNPIRPRQLSDYIGQRKVVEQLEVFIQATKKRHEAMDHVLLFGPPGLGKTTLAHIIGHELGVSVKQTSAPALEKSGDLAAILTNLQPNDVFFIDEIHRLNPTIEEVLYSAMEDFAIDIMIGEGPSARTVRLDVAPFTLIGATTRAGMLSAPLRDRFGIVSRLEYYDVKDLAKIVKRSAAILGVELISASADELAARARGTPRIANRLLRRVRDYAAVHPEGTGISLSLCQHALTCLEIDECGFDVVDRRLLTVLIQHFSGGPVGLDTLAASLSESRETIEDVIEPYMIQQGFLARTPRGRVATERAYRHLGLPGPAEHSS